MNRSSYSSEVDTKVEWSLPVVFDEFREMDVRELAASVSKSAVIVDCAHILSPMLVEKAGLIYREIGRGVWSR